MFRRLFLRPVVPAVMAWAVVMLVVFLLADRLLFPWMAGGFRPVVTVPSLHGLDTAAAADTLRARGLELAVDTARAYSRYVPENHVLSHAPDSGAQVKQGRRVWVRLSLGREPIVYPGRR